MSVAESLSALAYADMMTARARLAVRFAAAELEAETRPCTAVENLVEERASTR